MFGEPVHQCRGGEDRVSKSSFLCPEQAVHCKENILGFPELGFNLSNDDENWLDCYGLLHFAYHLSG